MKWVDVVGTWALPPDAVAWCAVAVGLGFALRPRFFWDGPGRRFLAYAATAAALLSLGYIAVYLRGGPRIIDATSYFLQGRALSQGHLSWSVVDPSASFRGRFLLFHDAERVSGIFPPGFPLLLAAGFLVGAPMVVGPVIAALLVVLTYRLTEELGERCGVRNELAARCAACLSVVCGALRYHTADTMAHGAAALWLTGCLLFALRASRSAKTFDAWASMLCLGALVATRPVSAIAVGAYALFVVGRQKKVALLGILPGVCLLLASQKAATGSFFGSTQLAYYAVSDGPPGCFRYGFGAGIGCQFEHGDFVHARLQQGYGVWAALGTTLRRLKMHITDVANFEPLALFIFLPLLSSTTRRAVRWPMWLVLAHVASYAPFYFDGNYPGGGARFFADLLPLEHALLALGISHVRVAVAPVWRAGWVVALACFGFAVHGVFGHVALRDRDGGRPMYEPDVVRQANYDHGILFVDTDHGFNLAHVPEAEPSHALLVARARGDDHDRLLHDRLGHPPARRYEFGPGGPRLLPFTPSRSPSYRFEAEADWPPLAQIDGYATPMFTSGCATRVLALQPTATRAFARIELPVPTEGTWRVSPRVRIMDTRSRGALHVLTDERAGPDRALASWHWSAEEKDGCLDLEPRTIPLPQQAWLLLEGVDGLVALDHTTLDASSTE